MAVTKLQNLVNPAVYADMVEKKLVDAMRFAPLATIDYTLVGVPGATIYLPAFSYIGDAAEVAEGSEITPAQLTASSVSATIHKIAKAVEITDEAVLSGMGNPLEEAVDQTVLAIASKEDNDMLAVLAYIASDMTHGTSSAVTPADLSNALELFGEDIDGQKVAVVSPRLYTALRNTKEWLPASEIAADRMIKGAVGEAYGCQVIVSNKLKNANAANEVAYIVKPGALRLFLKRETNVEVDRNILKKETIIATDKHGVCYLYDASKAIKIAKSAG